MADDNKGDVTLSLTVTLNKEGNKVVYAVADRHFVDILLSFLTLPLGRIVKVLQKNFGDKAPTIGSLNSLYNGIANLDASHFVKEAAKKALLDSRSPFEAEYESLKLDITDSPPPEYFFCRNCIFSRFRIVSVYYDIIGYCNRCNGAMSKEVVPKSSAAASGFVEVYTKHRTSFIISDGLSILSSEKGFQRIIDVLGITDTDIGKSMKVDLGFSEIVKLLKASLTSPTPLSDVILNRRTLQNYAFHENQPSLSPTTISSIFILKVMIQKSSGKLLYAHAKKDFIEFLFSLLYIPLGEVEHLMAGKTCFKAIDNLYRSTSQLIDDEDFSTRQAAGRTTKCRLMKPNVVHGCTSNHHILRLNQEPLPAKYYKYNDCNGQCLASSVGFPKGLGLYLQERRTYIVTDDLIISPYCFVSILSSLRQQKILLSDIKEVDVKIGFKEALSILKASLTSTSALTDALLNDMPSKQVKREV